MSNSSQQAFVDACRVLVGGVNSPVRSFASVDGKPPFIASGDGAYLTDIDGRRYLDYVGSYGAAILGHAHPEIIAILRKVANNGLTFGAPTLAETELAEIICSALPSVERVRLVSSGTEACLSAVRLARAYTNRRAIVKFSGCYHGHGDMFLVAAGSGATTQGIATSRGVMESVSRDTHVVPYNDVEAVERLFAERGHEIAALIVEPIVGNCGFIRPIPGFLALLRDICNTTGSLLIFDEVMTGFRVAWGGVQTIVDIVPDLTTLGKVIGGGLPLAAFAGRAEIMELLAPAGDVYQAGTMSGNPLAVACGIKTLEILARDKSYQQLTEQSARLCKGLHELTAGSVQPMIADSEGGMLGFFFSKVAITNAQQAMSCDRELFKRFFHHMLMHGVYLAPSPFEASFISICHGDQEIDYTLACCEEFVCGLSGG